MWAVVLIMVAVDGRNLSSFVAEQMPINVNDLKMDLASLSSHKVGIWSYPLTNRLL